MAKKGKEAGEGKVVSHVLGWAREDAGYSPEEIAASLKVPVDRLLGWESGEPMPMGMLERLAARYKRPFVFFLLSKPPAPSPTLPDFRSAAGEPRSPALIKAQREAMARREVFVRLVDELGLQKEEWTLRFGLDDDPEKAGAKLRHYLGVPPETRWRKADVARKEWQDAGERRGVLVFHASKIGPISEVRGLSIMATPYPVVILNGKDFDQGRSFTLLHEYTHLALRSGGVCNLAGGRREEAFCNAVAASALMPRDELLALDVVTDHRKGAPWSDSEVAEVAGAFAVSSEAALLRLVKLKLADGKQYGAWRERYEHEVEHKHDGEESGGGNSILTFRRNVGTKFLRVMKSGVDEGVITLHSASQAAGVGAPTFEKMLGAG